MMRAATFGFGEATAAASSISPFYRPPPLLLLLRLPAPGTQRRTCPCACNSTTTATTTGRCSCCPSRTWMLPTRRGRRPNSPRIRPTRLALVRHYFSSFLFLSICILGSCIHTCSILNPSSAINCSSINGLSFFCYINKYSQIVLISYSIYKVEETSLFTTMYTWPNP